MPLLEAGQDRPALAVGHGPMDTGRADPGRQESGGNVLGVLDRRREDDGLAAAGLLLPMSDHLVVDGYGVKDGLNGGLVEIVRDLADLAQGLLGAADVHDEGLGWNQEAEFDQFPDRHNIGHVREHAAQAAAISPLRRGREAGHQNVGVRSPGRVDDGAPGRRRGVVGLIEDEQVQGRDAVQVPGQGLRHGEHDVPAHALGVGRIEARARIRVDLAVLGQVLADELLPMLQDQLAAADAAAEHGQHDGFARPGGRDRERIAVLAQGRFGAVHQALLVGAWDHDRDLEGNVVHAGNLGRERRWRHLPTSRGSPFRHATFGRRRGRHGAGRCRRGHRNGRCLRGLPSRLWSGGRWSLQRALRWGGRRGLGRGPSRRRRGRRRLGNLGDRRVGDDLATGHDGLVLLVIGGQYPLDGVVDVTVAWLGLVDADRDAEFSALQVAPLGDATSLRRGRARVLGADAAHGLDDGAHGAHADLAGLLVASADAVHDVVVPDFSCSELSGHNLELAVEHLAIGLLGELEHRIGPDETGFWLADRQSNFDHGTGRDRAGRLALFISRVEINGHCYAASLLLRVDGRVYLPPVAWCRAS